MAKAKSKKIMLEDAIVPVDEQPYQIPENWCWTRIKHVSDVVTGSTPSKKHAEYYGGDFPFFKPADLEAGDNVVEATEYLSEEGKNVSRIIPKLSTAVCCIGSIGKTGLIRVEGTTNQQINSMIPKINPLYLYYYSKSNVFIEELWNKSTATTISLVNKKNMETNTIPLAPLAEQKRIVEQIESLFSKLDEAKEKAQEVIDRIETNIEAILYNAFSGKLTQYWRKENGVDYNWEKSTLSKIVSGLKYGSSEKCDYNNNGTPVLRIPNIGEGVIDFSDLKYMQGELENSSHEVFKNDILIIRSNGSRDLVGKCAIVPALERRFAYASFLIRIKASDKVLPNYLVRYINSSMARGQLFAKAKSSSGIHNINSKELGSIRIDVPTIEEQTEILKIIEPLIKKELAVKNITSHMIENIAELKKSILTKAFRGELGTNVSSEESSIELLKKTIEEG